MKGEKKKLKIFNNSSAYFDYSLLFIVFLIVCFGLIMLYSASAYEADMKMNNSLYYLNKQILSVGIGLVALFILVNFNYHMYNKPAIALIAFFGCIVLILAVLSPIGVEVNGARRWLSLGMTLQPCEFAKLGLIVFMSYYINRNIKRLKNPGTYFMGLLYSGILGGLVAVVTSDLSSGIIIVAIGVVMLFVASPKLKYLIIVAGVLVAAFIAAVLAEPYRLERFNVWLHPKENASEGGYQILQSLYSLGSGGLFGKGLGNGIQKLGYVPEAQNDMIFTVICEELGVIGGIALILLFIFMIWRFMIISNNAPDLYGSMLVVGIMAHISVQTVMNLAVVTNSMPNTGVPLPFISYGGSSIMCLLMEIGIVLSVSRRIRFE